MALLSVMSHYMPVYMLRRRCILLHAGYSQQQEYGNVMVVRSPQERRHILTAVMYDIGQCIHNPSET